MAWGLTQKGNPSRELIREIRNPEGIYYADIRPIIWRLMLRDVYMQLFEKWPRSDGTDKLFVYQKQ